MEHIRQGMQEAISKRAAYLHAETVPKEIENRQGWSFTNPHTLGYAKVAEGKLDAHLHEEENSSDDAEQDLQGEVDIMSYLIRFSLLFLIQYT